MTQKGGQAVQRGPQKGAPPTLEWVAIDRLEVDRAYQRAVDGPHSRKIVIGMVKVWDWALCQPLVVSRRKGGRLLILDGQHRWTGAKERGDVPHLPCVMLSGCDNAAEAETFVALNTRRQKLSQCDLFNGMLAAGDPDAVATAGIIVQTGWRQARNSNTAGYKPGELFCAPMLARAVKAHGAAPVRNALTAMREAWPDTAVTVAGTLLRALIAIYRDGDLDGGNPDLFISVLGSCEPQAWIDDGRDVRRRSPMFSQVEALAQSMLRAYEAEVRDLAKASLRSVGKRAGPMTEAVTG